MKTIKDQAKEFKAQKLAEKTKEADTIEAEHQEHLKHLETEFNIRFADALPLLKAEGITVSFHKQNKRYKHMGTYVQFTKGAAILKMDFSNRSSYRYEYIPYQKGYGSACYGAWPLDRFYEFIYDGLLSSEQGAIMFENPELKKLSDLYEYVKDDLNAFADVSPDTLDKLRMIRDMAAEGITAEIYG